MFERPLKLTHNDSHKVFFTSDTHFRHNQSFIFEARGYKDRYEHDDALIAKINEVVRPEDTLIHLGDFCLNITPPEFNEILARINCQNIAYIWGNHNSCIRRLYEEAIATEYGKDIEVYPYAVGKITYLGYYKELIVNGHMIVIHHYPHQIFNQMQ
jgi:calcineurin-like phosphoesterase family protein